MLEKSYNCLKGGTSIMIFPEGTRSPDKEIGRFKRGAFLLAIQAGVPILPVLIDGTGKVIPKKGLIFRSGNQIRMKVLDPVPPDSFHTNNPEELAGKLSSLMTSELKKLRAQNDDK
jgi:1-acyl-sn-glycerol-3-phosphate acyltransferase